MVRVTRKRFASSAHGLTVPSNSGESLNEQVTVPIESSIDDLTQIKSERVSVKFEVLDEGDSSLVVNDNSSESVAKRRKLDEPKSKSRLASSVKQQLISEVQRREYMWHKKHVDHKKRINVDMGWIQVSKAIGLTVRDAKENWRALRDYFVRLYKKVENSEDEEITEAREKAEAWRYYKAMMFYAKNFDTNQTVTRNAGSSESSEEFDETSTQTQDKAACNPASDKSTSALHKVNHNDLIMAKVAESILLLSTTLSSRADEENTRHKSLGQVVMALWQLVPKEDMFDCYQDLSKTLLSHVKLR